MADLVTTTITTLVTRHVEKISPWNTVQLEKLIVTQLFRK
jgi:hypothetical protein